MKLPQPYDYICFTSLVHELETSFKKSIEIKIRKRLKYYGAGPYDPERVDKIRSLKEEIRTELNSPESSLFFNKKGSEYAELKDFNVEKMAEHYSKKYNFIDKDVMIGMINFAVYLYYLR